ncbi:hypothetical protein THAOC_25178, partial [Thalassiosira oceanica]
HARRDGLTSPCVPATDTPSNYPAERSRLQEETRIGLNAFADSRLSRLLAGSRGFSRPRKPAKREARESANELNHEIQFVRGFSRRAKTREKPRAAKRENPRKPFGFLPVDCHDVYPPPGYKLDGAGAPKATRNF